MDLVWLELFIRKNLYPRLLIVTIMGLQPLHPLNQRKRQDELMRGLYIAG